MDELLSRKIHAVLITVSGIQGLETKVGMFIPACISSVLPTLVRALCTLGCLHSELDPFETSPTSSMFLSSPFSPVFSQKFIFLHRFPCPQQNPPHSKIQFLFLDDSQKILTNCEFGLLYAHIYFYCDLLSPSPLSVFLAMGSWCGNCEHCRVVSCIAALQLLKICTPLFYCTVTSSGTTFISLVSPC